MDQKENARRRKSLFKKGSQFPEVVLVPRVFPPFCVQLAHFAAHSPRLKFIRTWTLCGPERSAVR